VNLFESMTADCIPFVYLGGVLRIKSEASASFRKVEP
jgi:hypothetical protein